MIFKRFITTLAIAGAALVTVGKANAQQGRWAAPGDQTAKSLIDMERQWAEQECAHSAVEQAILAEDFLGTTPEGKRYSKSEALGTSLPEARQCRLHDAKVHFFGENVAIVYGSESSIRKASDGKEYTRTLVWTDTWLKRNGKWQVVAAQDTRTDGR